MKYLPSHAIFYAEMICYGKSNLAWQIASCCQPQPVTPTTFFSSVFKHVPNSKNNSQSLLKTLFFPYYRKNRQLRAFSFISRLIIFFYKSFFFFNLVGSTMRLKLHNQNSIFSYLNLSYP